MKTNYKRALKGLLSMAENKMLYYQPINKANYMLVSDGKCIITVPTLDFEESKTYLKATWSERMDLSKFLDKSDREEANKATPTTLLIEDTNNNRIIRVYKVGNELAAINNKYHEIVKDTIYIDTLNHCYAQDKMHAIRWVDRGVDGIIKGGFVIMPIYMDVTSTLKHLHGGTLAL